MVFLERGQPPLNSKKGKTIGAPGLLLGMVLFFLAWDLWAVLSDQRLSSAEAFTLDTIHLLFMLDNGVGGWLEGVGPKGPLIPALALPLVWLIGALPLATRLVAVAAHAVLVWQAYALGRRLGDTSRAGLWSALICGSAPMIFGWARIDAQDLPLAVAVMMVVQVVAWIRLDRPWHPVVLGLALGVGLMVKAAILVYLVVPGTWLVLRRLRSPRVALQLLGTLAVAAAVLAPWFLTGGVGLLEYASEANRASVPLLKAAGLYLGLPGVLPLLLAAAAGFALLWANESTDRWLLALPGATVLVSLAMLCGLFNAWSRYLLPLLPVAAVLAGAGVARLQQRVAALARAPVTWGLAGMLLATFTGLNLAADREGLPRERRAGMLRPDSRPHGGLQRALDALGTSPPRFLLVCGSGEAFSRFKGMEGIWQYRGQDLHLVELSHLQHPAGGTVDVLVIDAHREPPIWNYDLAEDPVRDRHLARARWLRRQKKRLVATARDPDGVKYLAYKATPGGR